MWFAKMTFLKQRAVRKRMSIKPVEPRIAPTEYVSPIVPDTLELAPPEYAGPVVPDRLVSTFLLCTHS